MNRWSASQPGRWVEVALVASLLALAVTPFVAAFPEPPAFGRDGVGIVAAAAILATVGKTVRATPPKRRRILGWAALLLGVTIASIAIHAGLARATGSGPPTLDILPKLFGLEGEDIDDALLYEGWIEVWLCCAFAVALAIGLRARFRAGRRSS